MNKTRKNFMRRLLAGIVSVCVIFSNIGISAFAADGDTGNTNGYETVADPGTAYTFEDMMGTDADGNRYAGRVWVDKSVYTDGQTAKLNSSGEAGSTFNVALEDDEAFQIIFSALGSSMVTNTTTSSSGPMDVVLVLDNSASMAQTSSESTTRLQKVVEAANSLIKNLLTIKNVRIAIITYNTDSQTILELGSYTNGVTISADTYSQSMGGGRPGQGGGPSGGGILTAKDNSGTALGDSSTGYQTGTNLQSGIDTGMKILNNASNITGRTPVMIVLTDGRADTAVNSSWYNTANGTYIHPSSNDVTTGVALSTMLNASYMKSRVEESYGKTAMVYGVGVDLSSGDEAIAMINPADSTYGFNSTNTNTDIRNAYTYYTQWAAGNMVSFTQNRYTWSFDHNLPSTSEVDSDDVVANINYVDTYYDVSSAELDSVFEQIYDELSSSVFNPITSSTTVEGATGVDNTPLRYVDNIGEYMEVKNIQAVTLFGASYDVIKNEDGTYTVEKAEGTNPTTNEDYDTSEDIIITITENDDGTQRLQIDINQEILPILLEQVTANTVGDTTTATINELSYNPLRVYYTVGLASDILLPNGDVDITQIDSGYKYIDDETGEITFYSNAFGTEHAEDNDGNGKIDVGGAAHVGFQPSLANRYYYHQSNQGIFTKVTAKDGSEVNWDEDEYGVLYEDDKYNFTWMTYEEYNSLDEDEQVYTYVSYYRPTSSTLDAATAAEKVTYIVYTDWGYLKESAAFYDDNAKTYINYDATNGYATGDVGYAIDADKVEDTIKKYVDEKNPNAEIYAVLGVQSLRSSRLHNMTVVKTENPTETADDRYTPEFTHETAAEHNGNSVVVWVGNNGRLTTTVDTGIALTKTVTETIGDADTPYALTVTVPAGVTATPVVKDADGNDVTTTISNYYNNTLTVNVKAGETVYISGIPAGTECTINENIPNGANYGLASISPEGGTVTIPTLSEVLEGKAAQYVAATVTNAPKEYGNLYITKEITSSHNVPESILEQEFTVTVHVGTALANQTYTVKMTASDNTEIEKTATVDNNGNITLTITARHTIEILGLPAGTEAIVTETLKNSQKDIFEVTYRTRNQSGADSDEDNVVVIPGNANATAVITNAYTPKSTTVDLDIEGTKIFTADENANLTGGSFTFKVQQWNGTGWDDISGKTTQVAYAADEDGTKTFTIENVLANIIYKEAGTWSYQVLEVKGGVDNVTYDRTLYTFTVTVVDNDGQLVATVTDWQNNTITDGSYEVSFTNTYHTAPISVDIVKDVVNNSGDTTISKAGFEFTAVRTDASWNALTDENAASRIVYSDAAGEARFTATYTDAGTYYYVVTEAATNGAGWTYSNAEYHITVVVASDNNGDLKATMTIEAVYAKTDETYSVDESGNSGKISFVNTYDPEDATVNLDLAVKKVLTGRTLNAGEFTFEVYNNNDREKALLSGTNKADGAVDFDGVLTFSEIGKYEYDIIEATGSLAGVTYDETVYDLVVEVVNDATNGKLVATYYFEDAITNTVTFKNTYTVTPTEYTISGTKTLTGRALSLGEFSFALYEGNNHIETVTNKVDGTFAFSPITYTKAGEHTYTVKEVVPEGASYNAEIGKYTLYGVTYDPISYTVKVTVTDNDSILSAVGDPANADIQFTNSYAATPAEVTFNGTKTLIGRTLENEMFTFKLYRTDGTFNISSDNASLVSTVKNDANGEFSIKEEYNTTGIYFYVLVEDATDPISDIVYDSTQYHFRVRVADVGDGVLRATVLNLNTGATTGPVNSVATDIAFKNATFDEATEKEVYLAGSAETEIDGQKVEAGDILTYYITYTNYTGEDVVVDIMDTIPKHTSYVEESASHDGSYAGTHLNWVLNVAKGESVTVSFDVKVDETDAIVANTAIVRDGVNTYTTNEVVNHTIEDPVEKNVFSVDDTTVSIDGKKVYAGDTLVYTIDYTNASADKVSVKITDIISEHTTYVGGSADNDGVYADGKITWEIAEVEPWSTITVAFKVTVDANIGAETIKNKADVVQGNNSYTTNEVTNYTVEDEVKKDVFKAEDTTVSIDGKTVYAGEIFIYTISYKNTAKEKATVTITDTIPQYTTYVEGSADNNGVYADGVLTWKLEVEAGETVIVSFKATVNDAENVTVTNKAEILEGKNSYTTNEVTTKIIEEPENPTDDTPPGNTPSGETSSGAPKTGDASSTILWSSLAFSSLMACGVILIAEKKRKNEL